MKNLKKNSDSEKMNKSTIYVSRKREIIETFDPDVDDDDFKPEEKLQKIETDLESNDNIIEIKDVIIIDSDIDEDTSKLTEPEKRVCSILEPFYYEPNFWMLMSDEDFKERITLFYNRTIHGREFLTPSNLKIIASHRECLDDTIIYVYIKMLLRKYKKEQEILVIDPLIYPLLLQDLENGIPRYPSEELLRNIEGIQLGYKKILIPLHIETRYHWALLLVDIETNEIHYYDSMYYSPVALTQLKTAKRVCTFLDMHDRLKISNTFIDFKMVDHKKNTIPQQPDGNNCGLYVIIFSEYIMTNKRIDKTVQINVKQERSKMLMNIANDIF